MPESKKISSQTSSSVLKSFSSRHIGLSDNERDEMLNALGYPTIEDFINDVVPKDILENSALKIEEAISEEKALQELKLIASKNTLHRSFIGQGYYTTYTPTVILLSLIHI